MKKSSFPDSLRLLTQAVERSLEDHPEPEKLLAYHRGELSAEEAAEIEEHLTWCREDAALLLSIAAFSQEAIEAPSEEETNSALERFRTRLSSERDPETSSAFWAKLPGFLPRPPTLAYGLAASLSVVVVVVTIWAVSTQQRLQDASRPRPNVPIEDLNLWVGERSAPEAPDPVVLTPEADRVVLILNPSGRLTSQDYLVRLVDEGGRIVWDFTGLEPTAWGNFTLELSRDFLAPGVYLVELYGLSEGAERSLGRYAVEISQPTPDSPGL